VRHRHARLRCATSDSIPGSERKFDDPSVDLLRNDRPALARHLG
jgi:hypothetical protein